MTFTSKQVRSDTLGHVLQQTREDKGLSLKDVEQSTSIVKKYLEYLEADDFYKFPSATYTRGILKRYAEALELDAQSIVNQWEQEYSTPLSSRPPLSLRGGRRPSFVIARSERSERRGNLSSVLRLLRPTASQQAPQSHTHLSSRIPLKLVYSKNIIVLVILVLILLYIGVNIKTAIAPPLIEIIHPPDEFIASKSSIVVQGTTKPHIEVFINNQLIGTADAYGGFKQVVALLPGLNTIEISAKKKYSRMRTIYRQVVLEE
ncbi:helix-turn-helix domain-containing protein [Patescibacteria group bacterium AH-259-L07]|nr:helix-turn-helix domain-containing protein [Patescibacteria group bacterium AH-259-L07]